MYIFINKIATSLKYQSLLNYAAQSSATFNVKEIIEIPEIELNHTMNIASILKYLTDNPEQYKIRGTDLSSKLPFIAFALINELNYNEKLYIVVVFNRTNVHQIYYQSSKNGIVRALKTAHHFRNGSNNLEVLIHLIKTDRIENILSLNGIWIFKKNYIGYIKTYCNNSRFWRKNWKFVLAFSLSYTIYITLVFSNLHHRYFFN